jgi:hypothetical protein
MPTRTTRARLCSQPSPHTSLSYHRPMSSQARQDPIPSAHALVSELFTGARSAILAGSVVTGRATAASDLDIVVIGDEPDAPFRLSLNYAGWPAEVFVHTEATIHGFWALRDERLRPALAMMCARGQIVLDEDGSGARTQAEARAHLGAGPPALSAADHERVRYGLTDSLDDFLADPGTEELPFIVAALTRDLCEVAMENRRAFRGNGKWMYRMAREADAEFAADLATALSAVNRADRQPLANLARAELDAAGGSLFDGYRADGRPLLVQG